MNKLQVGFGKVDITPKLGISLAGHFETRYAKEVMDPLEAIAVAVSDGTTTALLVSLDLVGIPKPIIQRMKQMVTDQTGIPHECIYLHATHTHTGPIVNDKSDLEEQNKEYIEVLIPKVAEASALALADRKPARMGWAVGKAPNVAFIRRYRMKDGSVRTNPGINNPDILEPIGKLDDRVNVLRFDREGAKTVVIVNFGNHPDIVGGSRISADWLGIMRSTTEAALPECVCVAFNGCQGDVNHYNNHPKDTDRPLIYTQGERYDKGRYEFARYVGRAMAGTVLQEYDKVKYIDVETVQACQKPLQIPTNRPDPEEVPAAIELCRQLDSGDFTELYKKYPGMLFETASGKARRIVRLANGPDYIETRISVVAIGKVAFVGLPGETFSGVGFAVKEAEDWEMILPTCNTNDYAGYFPMASDYALGGYEAGTSSYKAGAAEILVDESKAILADLAR